MELTRQDICDAECPAAAQVVWFKVANDGDTIPLSLQFCSHHHNTNTSALLADGWDAA